MSTKSAFSTKPSPRDAALDIQGQLKGTEPKLVIFFASSSFDPRELAAEVQKAFPQAQTVGCQTAGEIVSGQMLKKSVVAMGFTADAAGDMDIQVVDNIHSADALNKAMSGFEKKYGEGVRKMDPSKYAGIVLMDGMSVGEETLMDRIGDLTNVRFVGGSAGDDLAFKETFVFANGKAHTGGAVLALLKPLVPFDIVKTQSFKVLDKKLVVTKANEKTREVIEFNGKPAAKAYAEALNTTVEKLPDFFMSNPVGLIVGDEPFVRSPQQLRGDKVVFYCNVLEGMELSVLQGLDIVGDTKKAVEAKKKEWGGMSGIVNFHCILRTLELEAKKKTEEYGKVFSDIPTVGFSTYGEAYVGHINQTSTMLVFK